MKIKLIAAILLTFAVFGSAFAQTAPETVKLDKAKLDKFFDTLAEKNKAMGSFAIAKDGKVVYSRAVGFSRIEGEKKTLSTVETKYRVGSITKMFTAVMLFQLVEEGKLKLSDPLAKFFPQIPNAEKITIEQILYHRSGIHSFTGDADFKTWRTTPKTKEEMLEVIAKSKPDFAPDEKKSYSNAGFVILGYVVEKLTGKSYQAALKERVTSKIGLKDTYLGGKIDFGKNESLSFNYITDWKAEDPTDLSIPGGAGAIISTPSDLTKFIQALFDLKLVSEGSLNQMKILKDGYGMGLFTFPAGGKTAYGHTGGIDSFNSMLIYLPEEKIAVAYSSNGMIYPADKILYGALDIYQNKEFTIPTFETIAIAPEILEKYVGVYAKEGIGLKITVMREGAKLSAQATGQSAFPLEATAEDEFKFDTAGIVLKFDAAKNQVTLKQRGREMVFTKEK